MSSSSARRSRAEPEVRGPGSRPIAEHASDPAAAVARPASAERSRALRHRILRPSETLEQVAAREREGEFFAGVECGGELVAIGSVRPEGPPGSWRVRSMAVDEAHRGSGYGALVLAALTEYARDHGAERVWCNARVPAIGFYEAEGWKVETGEPFWVEGAGEHHRMAYPLRD